MSMRIALFTDSYPPRIDGIARVCQLERQELERLGHEVLVVCPNRPGSPYRTDRGVIALPSVKSMLYEGLRLGRFTKEARQQLRDWQPDVIHIHTQLGVGLAGLRFGRQYNIPIINTCHADFDLAVEYPGYLVLALWLPLILQVYAGHSVSGRELVRLLRHRTIGRRRNLSRWLMAQFANAATHTTTPSDKITQQIAPYMQSPLHTIGFGAEQLKAPGLATMQFRREQRIAPETFVVVSTTRLTKEKRVDMLIDGLAAALRAGPTADLCLVIIGEGPEKRRLQKQARDAGISEHIRFVGRIDNERLRVLLPECNAYANACMRETFALTACEAALARLPLIMRDAQLQGVFVPDTTGLLFNNAVQLGHAINQLANQPEDCSRLGRAAEARAKQYTPENAVKRLLSLTTTS